MSTNISKNGILNIDSNHPNYLVNNFSETNTTTNWTFGGTSPTLSNGIEILTGANPNITSSTFTVLPDEIIVFEFTISVPTPSTTTSGPGIYLGTQYGQSVYIHSFNTTSKVWNKSTSTTTNPYFINSYNLTSQITMKNYILGYNVDVSKMIYYGETTNTSYSPRAIQLSGTTTTTYIRSGYNSNTSMVIHFSNPKIYRVTQSGVFESTKASISKGGVEAINIIEY